MTEYTYRFDPTVEVREESRRVYQLLDVKIPGQKETGKTTAVKSGEGFRHSIMTVDASNFRNVFLKVSYDRLHPGRLTINTPKLTLEDIQRILGVQG